MSEPLKSIGGIWEKQTTKGNMMLSISIEREDGTKENYVAFVNKYHEEGDKKPKWQVFKSRPVEKIGEVPF